MKSKKTWKFIKPFFENHKYRCQGALLTWFQKSEKMDFTWYLFKERSYDLKNVRKKNLWSFRIFTWNIFLFEQKLTKILTTRIVSFFFRPHSTILNNFGRYFLLIIVKKTYHRSLIFKSSQVNWKKKENLWLTIKLLLI